MVDRWVAAGGYGGLSVAHRSLLGWGTPVEVERRRRIRLCLAAYAYEVLDAPIMTDAAFDALARQSDSTIRTGRLDDWWAEAFEPHTGQWILSHPELTRVARLYDRLRYD